MCLSLPNQRDSRVVYKYYKYPVQLFNKSNKKSGVDVTPIYRSFMKFELRAGKSIKSNRRTKALTKTEKKLKRVSLGLHVFLSEADAVYQAKTHLFPANSVTAVVAFQAEARDLVAIGHWGNTCASAVYMKLTPIDITCYKGGRKLKTKMIL